MKFQERCTCHCIVHNTYTLILTFTYIFIYTKLTFMPQESSENGSQTLGQRRGQRSLWAARWTSCPLSSTSHIVSFVILFSYAAFRCIRHMLAMIYLMVGTVGRSIRKVSYKQNTMNICNRFITNWLIDIITLRIRFSRTFATSFSWAVFRWTWRGTQSICGTKRYSLIYRLLIDRL